MCYPGYRGRSVYTIWTISSFFLRGWHEHIQWLHMVFQRLREANLQLGHKKCTLARTSVTFLGHLVSEEGLRPDPQITRKYLGDSTPNQCDSGQIILRTGWLL